MFRETCTARKNWLNTVVNQGLSFPVTNLPQGGHVPYWCDDVAYVFSNNEIEYLEATTATLWDMALKCVEHVLKTGNIAPYALPPNMLDLLRWSYDNDQPSLYGRFDVAWDGVGSAKLLEFNGDTPTGLIEASVCQWFWLKDQKPNHDQFNSLHERLVDCWSRLRTQKSVSQAWFAHIDDGGAAEDWVTTAYMRDTATEAGLATYAVEMNRIGFSNDTGWFVDEENRAITTVFKLYPWEDMLTEPFAQHLYDTRLKTKWVEPAWKVLLSNKAMLATMWELFEGHELLLPAFLDGSHNMTEYAQKPLHGREGDGVVLHTSAGNVSVPTNLGEYGREGFCFQKYHTLTDFNGNHPVLGLWVVDGFPAGMGIRESDSLITDYYARFIPHYILDSAAPTFLQTKRWIDEDHIAKLSGQ